MGTTRRRKRGHTKGGDIHGEEIYTESPEQTRRGDYIERGLHREGRGIYTEMEYIQGRSKHGEKTTWSEDIWRGNHTEKGEGVKGLHGEGTTRRMEGTYVRRGNKHGEGGNTRKYIRA